MFIPHFLCLSACFREFSFFRYEAFLQASHYALTALQTLDLHLPDPAPEGLFRLLRGSRRALVFWTLNGSFWLGTWLLGLTLGVALHSRVPDLAEAMWLRAGTGLFFSILLREAYRMPSFQRRPMAVKAALATIFCMLLAAVEFSFLSISAQAGLLLPGAGSLLAPKLVFIRLLILMIWSGLYTLLHFLENQHTLELRATRTALAAREFELRHLQSQINPQFLLSALDGVRSCRHEPESVDDITRGISDYLRFLFSPSRPLEPLGRELDALQKFLTVQSSRVRGNIVFRWHWEPGVRGIPVPPMLVQPLLEDAFHDRPEVGGPPLQIWLTAGTEAGFLRLILSHTCEQVACCEDNCPERENIITLRERLTLQYGPRSSVERRVDNGWARVTVSIPQGG